MTCEFRDDVAAQLLGGLPAAEALRVDQHVETCDSCAGYRRRMAIVRTLLDGADHAAGTADALPPGHRDRTVQRMLQARRDRPVPGRLRPFLAGMAAAVVLGVIPLGTYTWTHRPGTAAVELVGTAAAPGAWGEVRLHPRTDGTIVDFEAGDLPTDPGRYQVTVEAQGTVLAQQELTVSTDGWGQIVLTTSRPLDDGYTITVTRRDGPRVTPVLRCRCEV